MAITINGDSGISGVDGSAATPALQGTDTNTGISFGTDEVNINTGGTTRAKVDSNGVLGIGITPDAFNSATKAIQFPWGSISNDTGTDANFAFSQNAYYTGYDTAKYIGGGNACRYKQDSGQHYWYTAASGSADATISWSERMRISSNGNVTLNGGNLVLSDGAGIDFSATSHLAGMSSELLNDYEQGEYSPVLSFNGGSTGIAYSEQHGLYIKIGKFVWVQITMSLTSKGTSTGVARLSLPFTTAGTTGNRGGGSFQTINGMVSINGLPQLYGSQSSSTAEIMHMSGTPGSQVEVTNVTNSNFGNNSAFRVCATFFTA